MNYEDMKRLYETVKPIRGTTIKPIGKRSKKHESIERIVNADGTESYAAKMYDTHCVIYHADSTFSIGNGGYHTTSTADFIARHAPFGVFCSKVKNRLWIYYSAEGWRARDKAVRYPISDEPIQFQKMLRTPSGETTLEPVGGMQVTRNMVDRKITRTIRSKIQPFLDYAKLFLSMSGGWVMEETIAQHFKPVENVPKSRWDQGLYYATPSPTGIPLPDFLQVGEDYRDEATGEYKQRAPFLIANATGFRRAMGRHDRLMEFSEYMNALPEDDFLYGLCLLALVESKPIVDGRVTRTIEQQVNAGGMSYTTTAKFKDIQVDYSSLRDTLNKYIAKRTDVIKTVRVEPSNKFLSKVA